MRGREKNGLGTTVRGIFRRISVKYFVFSYCQVVRAHGNCHLHFLNSIGFLTRGSAAFITSSHSLILCCIYLSPIGPHGPHMQCPLCFTHISSCISSIILSPLHLFSPLVPVLSACAGGLRYLSCVCVCVGFGVYKERRTYTQTQECGRLLSASLRTTAQASK